MMRVRVKTVVAFCGFVLALLLNAAPVSAQPTEAAGKTVAIGPSMPGLDPQAPSIYGAQGQPAVMVPGAGGTGPSPSNDTALGRGGIIVPIPAQPGDSNASDDANTGIAAAGSTAAAGADKAPTGSGRSFPLWAIIIGGVVVFVVLGFLFQMRRSNK